MDSWRLWQSIIHGFFIGVLYFGVGIIVYTFEPQINLASTFVAEFVFIVIVAVSSYWRIKSLKFGILFGLVVTLIPEIFSLLYGTFPFSYLDLLLYHEVGAVVITNLVIRFVGFPFAGFFGSYIWKIRKENY
jgi:hypothetical protein